MGPGKIGLEIGSGRYFRRWDGDEVSGLSIFGARSEIFEVRFSRFVSGYEFVFGGWVWPKTEQVENVCVFKGFLKGQKSHEYSREGLQVSEPERLGGGMGRVSPPPRRLVWRVWEVWRVCCRVMPLHAERQGPRRIMPQLPPVG